MLWIMLWLAELTGRVLVVALPIGLLLLFVGKGGRKYWGAVGSVLLAVVGFYLTDLGWRQDDEVTTSGGILLVVIGVVVAIWQSVSLHKR